MKRKGAVPIRCTLVNTLAPYKDMQPRTNEMGKWHVQSIIFLQYVQDDTKGRYPRLIVGDNHQALLRYICRMVPSTHEILISSLNDTLSTMYFFFIFSLNFQTRWIMSRRHDRKSTATTIKKWVEYFSPSTLIGRYCS